MFMEDPGGTISTSSSNRIDPDCPRTQERLERFRKKKVEKEYADLFDQVEEPQSQRPPPPPTPPVAPGVRRVAPRPPRRTEPWYKKVNWQTITLLFGGLVVVLELIKVILEYRLL